MGSLHTMPPPCELTELRLNEYNPPPIFFSYSPARLHWVTEETAEMEKV